MPGWIPFGVWPGCACPASKHPSNKSVLRLQNWWKFSFWLNLCSLKCSSSPVHLFVPSDICFILLFHHLSVYQESCEVTAGENTAFPDFAASLWNLLKNKIMGNFYFLQFTGNLMCLSPSHWALLAVPYSTLERESVYSCFVDNYWVRHRLKTHLQVGRPVVI